MVDCIPSVRMTILRTVQLWLWVNSSFHIAGSLDNYFFHHAIRRSYLLEFPGTRQDVTAKRERKWHERINAGI